MKIIQNILARLRNDDETVLGELFKHHFNYLLALPFRILKNIPESQDVVSEAFYEIWDIRHSYEFESDRHVVSILQLKIRNKAIDLFRARKYESTDPDVIETLVAVPAGSIPSHATIDRLQLVYAAISKLPAKNRRIMEMLVVDQMKVGEIAEELEIPQPTVTARRKRAIKLILQYIEKHDPTLRKTALTLLLISVLIILLKIF